MSVEQTQFEQTTLGRGMLNITKQVNALIYDSLLTKGICHLFIQHTSASLIICENADPDVRVDLEAFMESIAPDGSPMFCHDTEGPDDMPAHIRTVITNVSLSIPFSESQLLLGTWQGICLWEHRIHPHTRKVIVTLHGE